MPARGAVWRGSLLRGDVVRRALERLSAAQQHSILAAFVVVALVSAAVYWYMRREMR